MSRRRILLAPLLAALALAAGARAAAPNALPNLDGVWIGNGSIGLGLGTTFSFANEVAAAGVEAIVGGMLLVGGRPRGADARDTLHCCDLVHDE